MHFHNSLSIPDETENAATDLAADISLKQMTVEDILRYGLINKTAPYMVINPYATPPVNFMFDRDFMNFAL